MCCRQRQGIILKHRNTAKIDVVRRMSSKVINELNRKGRSISRQRFK